MSVTRIICEGCGFAQAWCTCNQPQLEALYAKKRAEIEAQLRQLETCKLPDWLKP